MLDTKEPTTFVKSLFPDLLFAPSFSDGKEQFDLVTVWHCEGTGLRH